MAAPTNTATTLSQVGNREDLSDVISRIAPEQTPFTSNIGSAGKAKATRHEWQLEDLATPSADNAVLEGDDTTSFDENVTTRVSNICQIAKKAFVVSGTQEVVDKAGRKSEIARQSAIKGIEIKRDIEAAMLSKNASRLESGSNARKMGGIQSWIETNVSLGSGGAAGGFNTSTSIVDAPTTGTNRAFTEAQVKAVMQSIFTNSGSSKRRTLYLSPAHKQVFSGFEGISEIRTQAPGGSQAKIVGAADVYVSDFGQLATVPVAYGLSEAALIIDHEYAGKATLRGYRREKLANTGDNEKYHMLCEETLVCRNEKAHGMIGDLS
jgi:hypothetical protein